MVCVPCFIIPVLLFIWHRFVQPILLRYWNPWAKRDAAGNVVANVAPAFPFECAGGACPFPQKKKLVATDIGGGGADGVQVATESGAGGDEAAEKKSN